nr:enoyl-CoA delta isomerase 1, mitochondrial-like [Leptinotarsa decemlineata]
MALRSLSKLKLNKSLVRCFSAEPKLVSLDVNEKTGFATLNMQRPPVNSLNLELLTEITAALTEAEKIKCRGMVLTSKSDGVFSAGLDIMEMYNPEPERMKKFWMALQDAWIKLYGTSYPTVAVINGHSPAGGCLLALSCEYRVIVQNYGIGLNETQLGIVAPTWFISSMKNVIGQRKSEIALTTGHIHSADEALQIGLVDEVVADKEEAIARGEAFLKRFGKIPPLARSLTKKFLRQATIDDLVNNREADLNRFVDLALLPEVQKSLGAYIQALKKKSSKSN